MSKHNRQTLPERVKALEKTVNLLLDATEVQVQTETGEVVPMSARSLIELSNAMGQPIKKASLNG